MKAAIAAIAIVAAAATARVELTSAFCAAIFNFVALASVNFAAASYSSVTFAS
jgi:hypothetical protein